MVWLSRWWPAVIVVALLGVTHWYAYERGVTVTEGTWSVKWARRDADDAEAHAVAEVTARTEEQRRAQWAEGVQRNATQALGRLQTDIDTGAADAQRLRDQLATLQSRLGGTGKSSDAPISSASTTRAAMVLSELLDRCVSQRQELAGAFDRSRVAGLACEQSYEGLGQ